ncbi:MAG: hypothetical protein AB7F98_03460 [Novosphingobium sp.]
MNKAERQLAEARQNRDKARTLFDARLASVRSDLEARGVSGRIADKIGEEARDGFDQALDVAKESRGVIAGTIAALALWFLRHPIIAWAEGLIGVDTPEKENSSE